MAIDNKLKGLKGLKGLTPAEYNAFIEVNKEKLSGFRNPRKRKQAAEVLYMNQFFIDSQGQEKFDALNDGTEASYNLRNELLKTDIVNKEWEKYNPIDANGNRDDRKGLGKNWEKYSELPTDYKMRILESEYLNPGEFESQWDKDKKTFESKQKAEGNWFTNIFGNPQMVGSGTQPQIDKTTTVENMFGKGVKKLKKDKNQRILDNIYNDAADNAAKEHSSEVSQKYLEIATLSDEEVKRAFINAINPEKGKNLGISEYASHYGHGKDGEITSEMKNFSIDDMRQVLAKKAVYDATMSPEMAATALNNEAKRYIKRNQSWGKKALLFGQDVGISVLSYSADKINGLYTLGLGAVDLVADKPIVMVDDRGEVIDPNVTKVIRDGKGNLSYRDKEGNIHSVHQEQMSRTTLHQMGKDSDGSDVINLFNQQYWTRAEQFGTLDEDEQKQYEQLGSSPYKVAYDPNEDSDLLYESYKMMSFGLADAASQLIPFGIGAAGKALSTASKMGKAINGLGKAMQWTGKVLGNEKIQGTLGAIGIANAYSRGAFQESLAQNLANAEETALTMSRNAVYDRYNTDEDYKTNIDNLIAAEAQRQKTEYIAQAKSEGMQIADGEALDKMINARAQQTVLDREVEAKFAEEKGSNRYAALQEKAIQGAGDAAMATFLPEAIKYGFVNTLGHRKFLYTNPTGVTKKVSPLLKGLKEVTTSEGRQRLATDASKFLTRGDKLKQFGKTVGKQFWGGAWTNGTDDMQVDAAERINEDSFNTYLQQYQNGEALADTYGFIDGMYSYWKGLNNSLGQESTWNAATVGGLGGILNFNLNFANIAQYATKEGRKAFKDNFSREVVRDANGKPLKNEDGTIKYKDKNDWRGKLAYFIQNGVINDYYGMKQSERDIQNHADYINNILDSYNDFKDIEKLVASDIAAQNAEGIGDAKTAQFVKALEAANALNMLEKDNKDLATMSSVVDGVRILMDKASQFNNETGENPFSEEELSNLLSQYYSNNPGMEQSDANNQKALYTIAQNAQKLKEATEAFDKAEEEMLKLEKNGVEIDPSVRHTMKVQQALNGHWQERLDMMKDEIGDSSSDNQNVDSQAMVASVGGRKNALALVKVYNKQEKELEDEITKQKENTAALHEKVIKAEKAIEDAKLVHDSDARFEAENQHKEALANEKESKQQEKYFEDMLVNTQQKRGNLLEGIKSVEVDGETVTVEEASSKTAIAYTEVKKTQEKLDAAKEKKNKWVDENGNVKKGHNKQVKKVNKEIVALEKELAKKKDAFERSKEKILTADEIFGLDVVSRARMLNPDNRDLYSLEQQREIEKLENELIGRDAGALQKIQDIALLTQRIASNKDAYSRIAKNPEAAAVSLDMQRMKAAEAVKKLFAQRSAEDIADFVNTLDEMWSQQDVPMEDRKAYVFNLLKTFSPDIIKGLDALEVANEDALLPNYQNELHKAKDYIGVLNDVASVVWTSDRDETWKNTVSGDLNVVINNSTTREELLANLEKVVGDTDGTQSSEDFNYILKELETLGYQRDATVVESREQRKKREEAARKAVEEEELKKEEEAAKAAEKAAEAAERSHRKGTTTVNKGGEIVDTAEWKEESDGTGEKGAKGETPSGENSEAPQKVGKEKKAANTFNVGDELILTSYDADGNEVSEQSGSVKVIKIFDNGGIKVEALDGAAKGQQWEISPNKVKQFFGEVKPFTQGAHTDITYNDRLGDATPYKENPSEEKADNSEKSSTFAAEKNETEEKKDMKKESTAKTEGDDKYVVADGEETKCVEASIEDMAADAAKEGIKVEVSEVTEDASEVNAMGEKQIEQSQTVLSGNAIPEYVHISTKKKGDKTVYLNKEGEEVDTAAEAYHPLADDGRLIHKRGAEEHDNMNNFFAWMDAAGIKLQNIIDQELGEIIKRNPHAKVKFMRIKPDVNATHDNHMKKNLMLVLDYDNSINKDIKNIHLEDNGGIIRSNGKEYLVIGVAGYGKRDSNPGKLALYDTIFSEFGKTKALNLKKSANDFFDTNPSERFYVEEGYSTEVVPYSIIPGYIVKQGYEDESNKVNRPLSWLLDPENGRNPYGFTWDTLGFGIQNISKFLTVRASVNDVMVPQKKNENLGNAFVLVPASNGKFVPVHFNVCKASEMRDGALKDEVYGLLMQLGSSDYSKRYEARAELRKIFHLPNNGANILLHPTKPTVTFVTENGIKLPSIIVGGEGFSAETLIEPFINTVNPRVNITPSVFNTVSDLQKYDEAGALMTDIAMLATAGSAYSIYGLDRNGDMIIPENPVNTTVNVAASEGGVTFRKYNHLVPFKRQNYHEENGKYYLNGIPVTDEATVRQLDYNRRIQENNMEPVKVDVRNGYYVMSNGEHPEVLKIDKNSHEVKVLSDEEAKKLIKEIEEEKAKKNREANATAALDNPSKVADLDEEAECQSEMVIDDETGEIVEKKNVVVESQETEQKTLWSMPDFASTRSWDSYIGPTGMIERKRSGISGYMGAFSQTTLGILKRAEKVGIIRNITIVDIGDGELWISEDDWFEAVNQLNKLGIKNARQLAEINPNTFNRREWIHKARVEKLTEKPSADAEGTGAKSEESASNKTNAAVVEDLNHRSVENLNSEEHKKSSKTFTEMFNGADAKTKFKIYSIIQGKWKDAPLKDFKKLSEFLKGKGMDVETIGTSKEDVATWINTLENCK